MRAIIYECIQKFRGRKALVVEPWRSTLTVDPPPPQKYLKKADPFDRLQRDCPQPQAVEQFSQLCESLKDAPPKEQASRAREYFGVFGGARPVEGRRRENR